MHNPYKLTNKCNVSAYWLQFVMTLDMATTMASALFIVLEDHLKTQYHA